MIGGCPSSGSEIMYGSEDLPKRGRDTEGKGRRARYQIARMKNIPSLDNRIIGHL